MMEQTHELGVSSRLSALLLVNLLGCGLSFSSPVTPLIPRLPKCGVIDVKYILLKILC